MKSLMSCNCWSPQSVPAGRLLVDLGCGNGKYLGLHDSGQKYELGGDFSLNLLHILTSRGLEGRGYRFPFEPSSLCRFVYNRCWGAPVTLVSLFCFFRPCISSWISVRVLSTGVRLDLLHVPLRDGVAGGVLCIAALHHLATEARRIEAIAGESPPPHPHITWALMWDY